MRGYRPTEIIFLPTCGKDSTRSYGPSRRLRRRSGWQTRLQTQGPSTAQITADRDDLLRSGWQCARWSASVGM